LGPVDGCENPQKSGGESVTANSHLIGANENQASGNGGSKMIAGRRDDTTCRAEKKGLFG
jgi:hypothetical protein